VYEADYILRVIAQLGAVLRRVMQRVGEEPDAALEDADEGIRFAGDLDAELVDSLTPGGLVMLLGAGGTFDLVRAVGLAVALRVRGQVLEVCGDADRASRQWAAADALLAKATEVDPAKTAELLGAFERSVTTDEPEVLGD